MKSLMFSESKVSLCSLIVSSNKSLMGPYPVRVVISAREGMIFLRKGRNWVMLGSEKLAWGANSQVGNLSHLRAPLYKKWNWCTSPLFIHGGGLFDCQTSAGVFFSLIDTITGPEIEVVRFFPKNKGKDKKFLRINRMSDSVLDLNLLNTILISPHLS
jgi:hypothetical protein